jgi:hypothetical protein
VLDAVKDSAKREPPQETLLDQQILRTALALASSFLITDTSTNPDPHAGSTTWFVGLNQLVDLLVVLHAREELELETINAASKVSDVFFGVQVDMCQTAANLPGVFR